MTDRQATLLALGAIALMIVGYLGWFVLTHLAWGIP
jgi:hypothetical protein